MVATNCAARGTGGGWCLMPLVCAPRTLGRDGQLVQHRGGGAIAPACAWLGASGAHPCLGLACCTQSRQAEREAASQRGRRCEGRAGGCAVGVL
jgi:hypothetical protein